MSSQKIKRFMLSWFKRNSHLFYPYSAHLSPNSEDVLRSLLPERGKEQIIDCGAHVGESAVRLARLFPESTIFSLEPDPEAFEKLNKLKSARIRPFNIGLSSSCGKEMMSVNVNSQTNSLLPLSERSSATWQGLDGLEKRINRICQFATLDRFVKDHDMKCVDLLKIDVQGAEFKVLEGGRDTLSARKVKLLQMELILGDTYVGQRSAGHYLSSLEELGYQFVMIADLNIRNGRLVQCDAFFEPHK